MLQNKFIVAVAAVLIFVSMTVFTVDQTEKAIKFKFGEIVKYDYEPGLQWKMPFPFEKVKKFDARILTLDIRPQSFLTAEKKNVTVDSFVKWRIDNLKKFYTASVGGDIDQANLRLEQYVIGAFRNEFGKRTIHDLVSGERADIRNDLINSAGPKALEELGIKVIDAQISRIDLPDEVYDSVYRRMAAERTSVANQFRSEGAELAERIRADADRQREVKLADAYREAEMLRGEGDAKSIEIYAKAYGEDSEFFSFYRSLDAYKRVFKRAGDRLIIDPDSDFFKYFKKQQ